MSELYGDWLKKYDGIIEQFDKDELYKSLRSLLLNSPSTIALNHKIMEKAIDASWVETIENGLVYVDNVMRNPRKTIENIEEVVPIALSKKITVDSVKHLAQHTDFIQSVDPVTGKITPSKVLNVHKEESMMTYENKFVNTLIDRLFIFIHRRYEKLKAVSKDEEVFAMEYNTFLDAQGGRKMNMTLRIETADSLETTGENGATMWERVEKLRSIIESYKASPFCQQMGNNYIRPPVMRTNAILKNVDLRACLTLWQFIESYDKVGYEINVSDSAQKPDDGYIQNLYGLTALNFLLFRSFTRESEAELETLKSRKGKALAPKILKKFDKEDADVYSMDVDACEAEISSSASRITAFNLPKDAEEIIKEIDRIILIETEYIKEEERKRLEALRIAEEKKRKQEEEERRKREEERRLEEERILALEKAERERKESPETPKKEDSAYSFATKFLPYVATPYDATKNTHEIKVNHTNKANFEIGCGTYNDPYIISDGEQLSFVAGVISGDIEPTDGTIVNFLNIDNFKTWCSNKNEHIRYVWDTDKFYKMTDEDTFDPNVSVDLATIQKSFSTAYFKLGRDITLPNTYIGLGDSLVYSFKGVIDGSGYTITNKSIAPLIVNSTGCVIKDVTVKVDVSGNIALSQTQNAQYNLAGSCTTYGAVIGQVFGGDNIIDNVKVTFAEGTKITTSGSWENLIAVGGYVGVVR